MDLETHLLIIATFKVRPVFQFLVNHLIFSFLKVSSFQKCINLNLVQRKQPINYSRKFTFLLLSSCWCIYSQLPQNTFHGLHIIFSITIFFKSTRFHFWWHSNYADWKELSEHLSFVKTIIFVIFSSKKFKLISKIQIILVTRHHALDFL